MKTTDSNGFIKAKDIDELIVKHFHSAVLNNIGIIEEDGNYFIGNDNVEETLSECALLVAEFIFHNSNKIRELSWIEKDLVSISLIMTYIRH